MIDSGSDYCIFSSELAVILDIKLSRSKASVVGVGKEKVSGNWGEIEMRIGGVSYEIRAIFAEISDFGHVILGQRGFFKISYRVGNSAKILTKKDGYITSEQFENPKDGIIIKMLQGNRPLERTYNCRLSSGCLQTTVENNVQVTRNICL